MKNEFSAANIPTMSVGQAVDMLGGAYLKIIGAGASPGKFPAVMLWGPPGVGKSVAVRQIAAAIEAGSGRKTAVTDVRLMLFNPIDLRGIPVANEDRTLAVWLKPRIFQMDPGDDTVNILFLDEISAAPQSVQAAAYQITLDRAVGEHKLPDNCIVIAAGNRVTDRSVSFKMPKALANRLLHIEIEGNFESWRKWAISAGINDKVLGYLSFRKDRLFGFDAARDELAFPTPRSWEKVSDILNMVKDDADAVYPLISGLIGTGEAVEFKAWCRVYGQLPSMEAVFGGTAESVPRDADIMYALVCSMTAYASDHRYDTVGIGHSLDYAKGFPADFGELLIRNYCAFDKDYEDFLRTVPEYAEYGRRRGGARNGNVWK